MLEPFELIVTMGGTLTDLNLSRLSLLRFRQHDRYHAVFHLGADLALVELIRNFKAARVMANDVLGVHRLHSLILRKINPTLDRYDVIFNARFDAVAVD